MKLAIEEQWNSLTSEHDSEELSSRVEGARLAIVSFYKSMRQEIQNEREALEQEREALEQQTDLLEQERVSVSDWLSEREELLSGRQEETRRNRIADRASRGRLEKTARPLAARTNPSRRFDSQSIATVDGNERSFPHASQVRTAWASPPDVCGGTGRRGAGRRSSVSDGPSRSLGRTGLRVTPLAFGSFKIGRNEGIKYPQAYDLPDERACESLLNSVLDLGINLIDTAPAYGIAEERIGKFLSQRRDEYFLSSKAGERFENGVSIYDFSAISLEESVKSSLRKLQTDHLDLLLVHTPHDDLDVLNDTPTVETFQRMKAEGLTRAIGFSGKNSCCGRTVARMG